MDATCSDPRISALFVNINRFSFLNGTVWQLMDLSFNVSYCRRNRNYFFLTAVCGKCIATVRGNFFLVTFLQTTFQEKKKISDVSPFEF
jgi:hypothetical protein